MTAESEAKRGAGRWCKISHSCVACGAAYVPNEQSTAYDDYPFCYADGIRAHCLACWLGLGSKDG